MSSRTGLEILDFAIYGGQTGSASVIQMSAALDMGWQTVEDYIGTNIIVDTETQESHLWPYGNRDYNQGFDTIRLKKHHVVSVTAVIARDDGDCSCTRLDYTGCALMRDALRGLIDVRECNSLVSHNCGCGAGKMLNALITYTAGLFTLASDIPDNIKLAVSMLARQYLDQMTATATSDLGSYDVVSWRSMDYSETRKHNNKGNGVTNSPIGDFVGNLLKPYVLKPAFSLRKTF